MVVLEFMEGGTLAERLREGTLSPPITFEPRSVIGLHIEPVSNFAGELFVVLHGYRILGATGSTTDPGFLARRRPTRRLR